MKGYIRIDDRAETGRTVIDIEGVIGVAEQMQFADGCGSVSTYGSLKALLDRAAQTRATGITVNIRSTGGSVQDALLIYDYLRSTGAQVTTHCFGYVASAATIIAQAASPGGREISANALYLIHNSSCEAEGSSGEMAATADMLRQTDERIAAIYASRSGRPAEGFRELMGENGGRGRWLSPEEVVGLGLADTVAGASRIRRSDRRLVRNLMLPPLPARGGWKALLFGSPAGQAGIPVPEISAGRAGIPVPEISAGQVGIPVREISDGQAVNTTETPAVPDNTNPAVPAELSGNPVVQADTSGNPAGPAEPSEIPAASAEEADYKISPADGAHGMPQPAEMPDNAYPVEKAQVPDDANPAVPAELSGNPAGPVELSEIPVGTAEEAGTISGMDSATPADTVSAVAPAASAEVPHGMPRPEEVPDNPYSAEKVQVPDDANPAVPAELSDNPAGPAEPSEIPAASAEEAATISGMDADTPADTVTAVAPAAVAETHTGTETDDEAVGGAAAGNAPAATLSETVAETETAVGAVTHAVSGNHAEVHGEAKDKATTKTEAVTKTDAEAHAVTDAETHFHAHAVTIAETADLSPILPTRTRPKEDPGIHEATVTPNRKAYIEDWRNIRIR